MKLVTCFAETIKVRVHKISIMGASKLLLKRWKDYLIYFNDTKKVLSVSKDISVVKDFLEKLIRLPPKHELEFMIKLEARVAPISKRPY